MTGRTPRLDIAAIKERAREPLQEALAAYRLPETVKPLLTVGAGFTESDEGIVEVYVAGQGPADAVFLATAVVDRYSGRVVVSVKTMPSGASAVSLGRTRRSRGAGNSAGPVFRNDP